MKSMNEIQVLQAYWRDEMAMIGIFATVVTYLIGRLFDVRV